MRIALVASMLPPDATGGAEAYVHDLARALATDHEVLVLSTSAGARVPGARVRALPALPAWDLNDSVARKALWHARDQWRPAVHRAVAGELERLRPDVVQTHNLQGLSAAPLTAIARSGVPHVHMAHDLGLLCVDTWMTRGGAPCGGRCAKCVVQRRVRGGAAARSASWFLAPSRYILDRHLAAGVARRESSEVIPHGVPPAPAHERSAGRDGPTVGFIGTLAVNKGVPTLLRALEAAPPELRLLVAGSGPLERTVRDASAGDPRLEYVGYVGGDEKDRFFDSIDMLAVPSRAEPAGLVTVEAAIRGIPAVVSDRGGLLEVPEAVTFPANDPDALLAAIRELAVRLPGASRRLIERRREFLWDHHLESVKRVLEKAGSPANA